MTIEEKRARIIEHCNNTTCAECKLADVTCGVGGFVVGHDTVEKNYKILFGDDEPVPDQHFITAEPVEMEDDADTIIKIKSSRPIDSVTIYFKEDK